MLNASLTDCVFALQRASSADEVNPFFAAAAKGLLAGILEGICGVAKNDGLSSEVRAARGWSGALALAPAALAVAVALNLPQLQWVVVGGLGLLAWRLPSTRRCIRT